MDCDVTPLHEDCVEIDPLPYEFDVSESSLTKDSFLIEPMRTEVRSVDGVNVLFQYDKVVPGFDNWEGNSEDRKFISLNGEWKFTFDPNNVGVEEQWYDPYFDDATWDDRQVPSSWDLYDNEYFDKLDTSEFGNTNAFTDGYAWFRKTFELTEEDLTKNVSLNFLSVSYRSWIYVNGEYVEAHDTGEDAFSVNIQDYLKEGTNYISVRVYRLPTAEDYYVLSGDLPNWSGIYDIQQMPSGGQDWWPYAGITRDVYIEITDTLYISKILTVTENSNLTIHAVITNDSDEVRSGTLNFFSDNTKAPNNIEFQINPNSVGVFTRVIPIGNYHKWSMDNPVMYTSRVEIIEGTQITDSLDQEYGNREFTIDGNKIYLNGERIWLKGTSWHEETSESGRSLRKDEYEFEYDMFQDLGFNLLRNSVYNRHPYAYELADERGILIIDEAQNMWMGDSAVDYQYETYRLHFALQAKTTWNQMNHPSVIMWGMMNEPSVWSRNFYNYTKELVDVTKLLDLHDRPTLGAFRTSNAETPVMGLMDIIGINEYFGFHHGAEEDLEPFLDWVAWKYPDKPILITENGAWSTIGDASRQAWHAGVFRSHYGAVAERSDQFIGYTFWVLKDYKSRRDYSSANNGVSGMGVVPFDHTAAKMVRMDELGLSAFAFKTVYYEIKNTENPMDGIGFE